MKRIIVFLITLLCLISLSVSLVQGQEGVIVLKSKEVRSQFPEGVVFEATTETVAPEKIQEIKLEMGIKGSQRVSYAYLEFTPDTRVQGKYLLHTGGAQYKPPGTLIEYRFVIKDSAGRTLETPKETFLYMDNRFEWEKISEGPVEVYYYYAPVKGRAESALKASIDTVTKMGVLLGVVPAQTIRVIGYNDYLHMTSALPFQSKTTEAELIRQGVAFYDYGVLLELIGDPQADDVARHELTHMLVREATKEAFVQLPVWLDEGLAEYAMTNPDYSHEAALSGAISSNKLLPLRHMQSLPGKSSEILLVYGEGRSVIKYLIDTYGEGKMRDLFAAFNQGLQIDEALKKVYGFDQDGLDNAWHKSLGLPPLEQEEPTQEVPSTAKAKWWAFGCAPAPSR